MYIIIIIGKSANTLVFWHWIELRRKRKPDWENQSRSFVLKDQLSGFAVEKSLMHYQKGTKSRKTVFVRKDVNLHRYIIRSNNNHKHIF